eukprot:12651342-Alexandrium_andersonii.AAC.1
MAFWVIAAKGATSRSTGCWRMSAGQWYAAPEHAFRGWPGPRVPHRDRFHHSDQRASTAAPLHPSPRFHPLAASEEQRRATAEYFADVAECVNTLQDQPVELAGRVVDVETSQ